MVGNSEEEVTSYLDSLNSLKPNPYYKIKKEYSREGDLVLSVDFSLIDQKFYTCLTVTAFFVRKEGIDYCIQQVIYGYSEYVGSNVNYLKDNFKHEGESWQIPFNNNDNVVIKGLFDSKMGEHQTCTITYWLESK